MADIARFIHFIKGIAESDLWEYGSGESMTDDAIAFFENLSELPACCDRCMHLWRDCDCEAGDR